LLTAALVGCASGSSDGAFDPGGLGPGDTEGTTGSLTGETGDEPTTTTTTASGSSSGSAPSVGCDAQGEPCDDQDPCTLSDACDAQGDCVGAPASCDFNHTQGGTCIDGMCQGMTCDVGWGDCDGNGDNGCETPLQGREACEVCAEPCVAGPNATAICNAGTCEYGCEAPFENCDGDWSNGCEIPTGVPNQCDAQGLNSTTGCWTAACGNSTDPDAVNFGSWFCFECTTCHSPAPGICQWCDHQSGTWYPTDSCACGAFEDLVCTP
jgi:hypothetical protein